MGHIMGTTNNIFNYLSVTISQNWVYKLTLGAFFSLLDLAVHTHWALISAFFVCFFIDLITGMFKAFYFNIFSSRAFFKWASKLLVYGIFIAVFESIDIATWIDIFLPLILGFIIYTDAVSILENLEQVGVTSARPLRKILQMHRNKFIQDKLPFLSQLVDIERDIDRMKNVYIPMIPDKTNKRMFQTKIVILEKFLSDVSELDTTDLETFKSQFFMLLNNVWPSIEVELSKSNFNKQEIALFLSRHFKRVDQYKVEIDKLYKVEATDVSHIKNNVLQATVRIMYAWISDNIEAGIEITK